MCILTVSSWLYNVLAIGKVTGLGIKGSGLLHGPSFSPCMDRKGEKMIEDEYPTAPAFMLCAMPKSYPGRLG